MHPGLTGEGVLAGARASIIARRPEQSARKAPGKTHQAPVNNAFQVEPSSRASSRGAGCAPQNKGAAFVRTCRGRRIPGRVLILPLVTPGVLLVPGPAQHSGAFVSGWLPEPEALLGVLATGTGALRSSALMLFLWRLCLDCRSHRAHSVCCRTQDAQQGPVLPAVASPRPGRRGLFWLLHHF